MSHILEDLKQFLETSPTSWHAVGQIGNRLAEIDFTPLEETEKWELEPGKKYFVQRGGSMCAFSLPLSSPTKMVLLASHTDSPALKLKPNAPIVEENMLLLETEVYGSPLLSSWLNRDLAIAGRIVVQNSHGEVEEKLVFLDEVPVFIPQLAVHLDREANEKGVVLNKQEHLRPIVTLCPDISLETLLKHHHDFSSLLAFDLFLVPLEAPRFLGMEGEMIASYRLDNLCSAHACTAAIVSAKGEKILQLAQHAANRLAFVVGWHKY